MVVETLREFLCQVVDFPGLNGKQLWTAIQNAPVFWVDSILELHDYAVLAPENAPMQVPAIVTTQTVNGLSVFAAVDVAAVGIQAVLHKQLSYVPRQVVFEWLIQANQVMMMNYVECSPQASSKSPTTPVVAAVVGELASEVQHAVAANIGMQRFWFFRLLPELRKRMIVHEENIGREFGGLSPVWKVTLNEHQTTRYQH